ncbi:MAG: hypothetical protein ACYS30_26315, partial [Planctomycetota bacterium]
MDSKRCTVCKEAKALSHFNTRPDRRSGYRSECKVCQYLRHKKREQKHRKKITAKTSALLAFR